MALLRLAAAALPCAAAGGAAQAAGGATGGGLVVDGAAAGGGATPAHTYVIAWANASSGWCVDLSGADTSNGTEIQLWDCNVSPLRQLPQRPSAACRFPPTCLLRCRTKWSAWPLAQ